MKKALNQYKSNSRFVRGMSALFPLAKGKSNFTDKHDISRAQLVMIVSALDTYVHRTVRAGMLEIYHDLRPSTPSFDRFSVPLSLAIKAIRQPQSSDWIESVIRESHSYKSFQKSTKIAEAVALFVKLDFWRTVATEMGETHDSATKKLDVIAGRRDSIAHESDQDPIFPGRRIPILRKDVAQAIAFIDNLVRAIYETVKL